MLDSKIIKYINKSVLCWLATSSKENVPNVSPKEVFTHYNFEYIVIANIASPHTVKNILENNQVCISFIDVLVQKGFQLKGKAEIISNSDTSFTELSAPLLQITRGKFPFNTITKINIEQVKEIIAPKYILYPETTEEEQIKSAKKLYGL